MDLRYCPRCRADVEDAGGFCLLGHRLPVSPVADPMADLRAEVDEAFSKVRFQVESAFQSDVAALTDPAAVPVPARSSLYEELSGDDQEVAQEMRATTRKVYEELALDAPVSQTDPITAFSPSPRADWGPEKGNGRRSRR